MTGPFDGVRVLVAGAGVSGLAAATALHAAGARVLVSDDRAAALAELPDGVEAWTGPGLPDGVATVVTSPGRRPDHPLVAQAAAAGAEVIGEPELAWRLGAAGPRPPDWLVVTGTNGKTTTTEMLAAILRHGGLDAVACGNIGYPVVSAVAAGHAVLAVELSSFQLHWSPSVHPAAGVVLNVADDHLDWHGGRDGYAAAKARALTGDVAVAGIDDPVAALLLAASPAPRRVGVTLSEPGPDQLGVTGGPEGELTDLAFGGGPLVAAGAVVPPGPPGITDALAAAALARAYGVDPDVIGAALTAFTPGPHRSAPAGEHDGVRYLDDSKATNPHAADAALAAVGARSPGARAVWVVGGLLKGVSPDTLGELARRHADRLAGVVVIGTERAPIVEALARHAHGLPVREVDGGHDRTMVPSDQQDRASATGFDPMPEAVRLAAELARPGDVVLLAPAAASMDQFRDYAHRGDAFAAAVAGLGAA